MTRVVVFMEDGVIQDVIADNPCKVIILDVVDNGEKFNEETMVMYGDQEQYVRIEQALASGTPQRVRRVREILKSQGFNDA